MDEGTIKFVKDGFAGEYLVYSDCASGAMEFVGYVRRRWEPASTTKDRQGYTWFSKVVRSRTEQGPFPSRKVAAHALV